ncbi:MAG: PD-(D/E)XK nuclease family protein [Oscillospiraceae bacterium]
MLHLIIGRAKTGKSARVLGEICRLGDSSRQILLVPEHASHQAEVDLCTVCGDTACRHAEVLSFRLLASRVLTLSGGAAEVTLDPGGKLLTMEKTLTALAPALRLYRRPSQKIAFLADLVSLTDELTSYHISPVQFSTEAADIPGAVGEKLRDLALIYGAYAAKLTENGRDARDRMGKMLDRVAESGYLDGKDIFIDGFTYFNGQEEAAIAVMLRRAKSVTVTLLGEKLRRNEIFDESLKTRDGLVRLAQDAGVPSDITWMTGESHGALAHLEQHFFGGNLPFEGETDAISLLQAETAFSETEQVAAQIVALVASGAYRYRDITVAMRHADAYEATIENVFERYGIPVFLSRRSDILEKPVLSLLVGVLDAISGGYGYEDMFRFLKTGLAGLSPDDCDLLENYVLKWEIHGSMWLRDVAWVANPDGYGALFGDQQEAVLAEVNRLREIVRLPLFHLSEAMKASCTATDKVKALYLYLEELGLQQTLETKLRDLQTRGEQQLAEETGQLWEILCGVMDQFVSLLGDEPLDEEEFAKLFRLVLTQYSVGTVPVSLDQVTCNEVTRNDRHTVKVLFLLGANDHVLPAVDPGSGLLGEEDREELHQRGIRLAPTGMDQFHVELQNLYAALAQPTEKLCISYPVTDVAGSELRPSFLIGRILTLFPSVKLYTEPSDKCYRLSALLPALEVAGTQPGSPLWRYFAAREGDRTWLRAMENASRMTRGKLSPAVVQSLYGTKISMSASRVDKLRSCHFAYFMQYGLCAKERTAAAFDAPEIGTFLHYILENVTREVQALGGFSQVEKPALHRLISTWIDAYTQRELLNFRDKNARFRYLFGRLRRTVYAVVENVAAELAESDFVPLAFELSFGEHGALPAVTITEADTVLQLGGKVDRVDGWLSNGKLYLRVVDYKTGKKSFDLSEIRYGMGIQLLLYLFALQREGKSYFGQEIAPAGVLYLPARDTLLRMERNTPPEAIAAAVDKELRRSGLVLEAPEVLTAMEHSALTEPRYLPLRVGKDGSLGGAIASATQLGKLGLYVEKQLHQIAEELRVGNIDADPCCRNEEDSDCRFCEFASACHFQDGRGGDHLTYVRPVTTDAFWEQIDEETRGGDTPWSN